MADNFITVPADVPQQMTQYVEVSSLALKRAVDEVELHRLQQKKAADMRAALVKQLLDDGVLAPGSVKTAEAMLAEHHSTYHLLKAASAKIKELQTEMNKTAAATGEGVDADATGLPSSAPSNNIGAVKAGEYNSLNSTVIGEKTAFVKESDRPLLRLIGK